MRLVLLIQKYLIFVSLNFFFTSKLNFTQTGVSKASQCFLGPPGREPGWGPRMVQQRGRRELQLGKQSPHCSSAASALQSRPGASLRTQPRSSWRLHALFTQVSSLPREAQALQTCVTACFQEMDAHICRLPRGETEAHSGAGRLWG